VAKRTIDVEKLKLKADELVALAESVPPDIKKVAKGVSRHEPSDYHVGHYKP
jgi:hypothetical protein